MPTYTTVYRLEHNESRAGPWSARGPSGVRAYIDAMEMGLNPYEHPCPYHPLEQGTALYTTFSSPFGDTSDLFFGFSSIAQLLRWFPCEAGRRAMTEAGFHVGVYEVDLGHVSLGNYQVAFRRPATPTSTLSLDNLDNLATEERLAA